MGLEYQIPTGALEKETEITVSLINLSECFCYDNIQNGNEEGVDCGGSCPACVEAGKAGLPRWLIILLLLSIIDLLIYLFVQENEKA